jgi:hypothetical protein
MGVLLKLFQVMIIKTKINNWLMNPDRERFQALMILQLVLQVNMKRKSYYNYHHQNYFIVKKILKIWIIVKAIIIANLLIYAWYIHFVGTKLFNDEESELRVLELLIYTISSFLLIHIYWRMYETMKFVIFFDFIFLFFIGYYFRMNYIILFLELITISLIMFDDNDIKNSIKRKLRKINIYSKH